VHTIGGLSAHGDRQDLIEWYASFQNRPPVYLVHGEPGAQEALLNHLKSELQAPANIAERGQKINI